MPAIVAEMVTMYSVTDWYSDTQSVCHISACCLTGPHNPDNLTSLHTIIPCYRIAILYSRQLTVLDFIPAAR